mmetsp:Transcript_4356/g.10154  ORF Transcript_4356/g.10154 Transcript_4356/m.10154 type:complete len:205 (+) Transcript_4356:237-851(+)
MIFSSIVPFMMKRVARTCLRWPMRCARWMACNSEAGFHHGSMRKMWSAACKFSPSPPAFSEIRSTLRLGSVWKAIIMLFLACTGMLPRSFAQLTPSRFMRHSMSSRKSVNCEKTSALLVLSAAIMPFTSCISASILVELLNSAVLIFCMMLLFFTLLEGTAPGVVASSSSPSVLMLSGAKQTGQPMPPPASCGACPRYSDTQSR